MSFDVGLKMKLFSHKLKDILRHETCILRKKVSFFQILIIVKNIFFKMHEII